MDKDQFASFSNSSPGTIKPESLNKEVSDPKQIGEDVAEAMGGIRIDADGYTTGIKSETPVDKKEKFIYTTKDTYSTPEEAIKGIVDTLPKQEPNEAPAPANPTEKPEEQNSSSGETNNETKTLIGESRNKAKNNEGFENYVNKNVIAKVIAVSTSFAIIATILASCGSQGSEGPKKPDNEKQHSGYGDLKDPNGVKSSEKIEIEKDAYDAEGAWEEPEKEEGPLAFASAKKVGDINKNTPNKMLKYIASKQLETVADYVTGIPDQLRPEGFSDITAQEAEQKLEGMSDEEYGGVVKKLFEVFDSAKYSIKKIKGLHDNAYMKLKDPSKGATNENMELVQCVTDEDIEVTVLSWEGVSEQLMIKAIPQYDKDGNIIGYKGCLQVISAKGSSNRLKGLKEVSPSENKTDKPLETEKEAPKEVIGVVPATPTTPEVTIYSSKDGTVEKKYAGGERIITQETGPPTGLEEVTKVVNEAEEQINNNGMAGIQGEKDLQGAIDTSTDASTNNKEAEENGGLGASDRGDMFNNGDF